MTDSAFDHIIREKLQNYSAPVPPGLWEKIRVPSIDNTHLEFDSLVREKLNDYEAAVPADMWERIKPEEEKRRRIIFFLPRTGMIAASILFLILAGSVSAYLYYHGMEWLGSRSGQTDSAQTSGDQSPPKPKGSQVPPEAPVPESIQEERPTPTEEYKSDKPIENTATHPKENNNTSASAYGSAKRRSAAAGRGQMSPFEWALTQKNRPAGTGTGNGSTQQLNSATEVNNQAVIAQSEEGSGNTAYESNREKGRYFSTRRGTYSGKEKSISYFNHTGGIKSVIICPTDRRKGNPDWDLEVFAGPNYGVKSVSSNGASNAYMMRKDSSEASRVGFSLGFNIVKPLNDHFLLKTGLQYNQVNEKFTYRTENEVKTITVVSLRTIIRAPGDTLVVRDTSTVQQIGYKNNSVQNRYKSIDIPLIAGYRFGDDDFSIGLNAGVIFNLSSWYQGVILDTSFAAVPITKTVTESVYRNQIGLGLYGGISVSKKIGTGSYLFAEPFIRYNLSNMTTPQALYNQRFTLGGLSIGLRFNLNNRY